MVIQDLINIHQIELNLEADNKDEAIYALAKILEKQQAITSFDGFMQDVYEREAITSTGIGYGIAIPHAKSKFVVKPSVIFARHATGIPFDAMDGKDAKLFFMIAMPEDGTHSHLKVLAMLSRKLMHRDFREDLLDAHTEKEVLDLLYTMD